MIDRQGLDYATSVMTVEDVRSFCREYQIPSNVRPRAPGKGETAGCRNGEMSVYVHTFRASAVCYPLSSFLFSVLERFLPCPLSCRDLKRVIEDPAPPLLDCDRRLYKLLIRNASPALGFLEPLLVMDGMSTLWNKPGRRPAIMEEGEEMNLLKILQKALRAMEFVDVDADISIPLSSENVVIASPEQSLHEDVSKESGEKACVKKHQEVYALKSVEGNMVPETPVTPKVVLGIGVISSLAEKHAKPIGEPSSGMLFETEMGGVEAVVKVMDTHRSDVNMRFQQKVASLEDELVKNLEEKKQLLTDVMGLESEKLRALEEKVEMAHEFLDEKQAALDSAQDDLMASRVEVARLQEEVQGLRVEVQRLGVSQRTLVRDREWLVAEGCQRVFERIRGSNEYVQHFRDVNSACMAVGYQNGLRAGFKYAAQGTALEDSPCYDPTTQQWMKDSTLALADATPSILSQLAAKPHISLYEFQALTSVVDPNTPGA
ncbi:hypothetical protein R6Q57_021302 [Mikania cordata]